MSDWALSKETMVRIGSSRSPESTRLKPVSAHLLIDGESLTLEQVEMVARERAAVGLAPGAVSKMQASRRVVERVLAGGEVAYGINTGFGDLSRVRISDQEVEQLQHNLILSHSCGVGEPVNEEIVRALMLLRANALAKGFSGVRPVVVETLIAMLNQGIHPVIPSQGSVGASGDLVPLAHMALALIGGGEVYYRGQRLPASEALALAGLAPVKLQAKEGLALINGTQFMAAFACLNVTDAQRLFLTADVIAAMAVEALEGLPSAFDPRVQAVRPHPGQVQVAARLRQLLQGGELARGRHPARVQDAYTLRCIPQVHGASWDVLSWVRSLVEVEINSATDNPLIFADDEAIISGGNFHGQPLALATDALAMAAAEMGSIAERRVERLVNPSLSGLPPFLTNHSGLNSGFMIPQYVAAALASENKVLCSPSSVDSIPTSANQEDHVSMGAFAARKARQVLNNLERILAIELLCVAQALEFRRAAQWGRGVEAAYQTVRQHIGPLEEDRLMYLEIEKAIELVRNGSVLSAIREAGIDIVNLPV